MLEKRSAGNPKRNEVFYRPTPYDLAMLASTHDDREVIPPGRTYVASVNQESELRDVTAALRESFGDDLMFVGLTGSRVDHPERTNRDLDVLAIIDGDASGYEVAFEGDLKIVLYSGLKEFVESGYQLITTQFRKAKPVYEPEKAKLLLDSARTWKVVPEKAIPFLITKSKFDEQTSDSLRLMSNKYRAIYLHKLGFSEEAFAQLQGQGQDELFNALQNDTDIDSTDANTYGLLARHYANLGINKMFRSLSEMFEALYVKEMGAVSDVEPLVEWVMKRLGPEIGIFFRDLHAKRISTFKNGELLLDSEYTKIREGLRLINPLVEKIVVDNMKPESGSNKRNNPRRSK